MTIQQYNLSLLGIMLAFSLPLNIVGDAKNVQYDISAITICFLFAVIELLALTKRDRIISRYIMVVILITLIMISFWQFCGLIPLVIITIFHIFQKTDTGIFDWLFTIASKKESICDLLNIRSKNSLYDCIMLLIAVDDIDIDQKERNRDTIRKYNKILCKYKIDDISTKYREIMDELVRENTEKNYEFGEVTELNSKILLRIKNVLEEDMTVKKVVK